MPRSRFAGAGIWSAKPAHHAKARKTEEKTKIMKYQTHMKHSKFVRTPLITDVLHLQAYKRGQWIQLAWCEKPSRFYGMSERGIVTAFHFPRAVSGFNGYCLSSIK